MPGLSRDAKPSVAWAGFGVTLAGVIFQGGVLWSRVSSQEQEISELKATQAAVQVVIKDMSDRGIRNETKLDFLVREAMKDGKDK